MGLRRAASITAHIGHLLTLWRPLTFDIPHPYERTYFNSILVCRQLPHQLLLRWVSFFVGPSWQHLSSSISANQVLSWSLEPPNRVLAVDCVVVWASQCSLLSLTVFTKICCPVLFLSSSSVTLSFQDMLWEPSVNEWVTDSFNMFVYQIWLQDNSGLGHNSTGKTVLSDSLTLGEVFKFSKLLSVQQT